jgi:hypothetical protein
MTLEPMRRFFVASLLAAASTASLLACGSQPKPTSTTPLTQGSASIQPSPAKAERVPADSVVPSPSISSLVP